VALVVGIAVGLIIARVGDEPAAPNEVARAPIVQSRAPGTPTASAAPAAPGAIRFVTEAHVQSPAASGGGTAPDPGAPVVPNAENAPAPVYRDSLLEMHEEFEREARDDSWAYLREAEIESFLVMETSVGNFTRRRIECRASLCEVDLSATGEQIAALKKWYDGVNSLPPGSFPGAQLQMRMASYSTEDNRADVRFIYSRPQLAAQPGN
jgi:hypothetical protein